MVYRLIAAFMFWRVLKQVERIGTANANSSKEESNNQQVVATVCCVKETGQEGHVEMIVNGRVVKGRTTF